MTNEISTTKLNRRQLIGTAAAIGVAAPLIAACGDDDDDSGGSGGGGGGDGTIKIGYVTPQTGPLASFGEADNFVIGALTDFYKDGLAIGDKSYKLEILVRDSESNSNTAATAANELITNDGVQLMCVAQTPDTTVPVVQACTAAEVPVLSNNAPWQPHYLGIGGNLGTADPPGVASEYNYHFFWGLEDVIQVFLAMWGDVDTNKVVGAMWPDDPDGNAWSDPNVGFPPALEAAGYTVVDPGRFPLGSTDFSAQIGQFIDAGVEIITGVMIPPDFGAFWAACAEQGFKPKVVSVGKCLLFPGAVASYPNPVGLSSEIWWSDKHPTTSSITGQTSKELADAYTAAEDKQWTQPIGYVHSLFEVAIDAIKRAGGADDKTALLTAIGETNLATISGTVDFTNPVVPHITKTPLVGGQWVAGETFDVEFKIVTNEQFPEIPLDGTLEAIA